VPLHVEIARREVRRFSVPEIARDGEGLEEHLGHDHGAPEVEHDPPIVQHRQRCRETPEIPMARVADRGTIRRRMLVDDLGA
jgi:hypothetical protein